jgi:hypothetical protein
MSLPLEGVRVVEYAQYVGRSAACSSPISAPTS